MALGKSITFLFLILPLALTQEVVLLNSGVSEESPIKIECGDVEAVTENDTLSWTYTDPVGKNKTITGDYIVANITDNTATGTYICTFNGEEKASYVAAKLTKPVILNTRKSVTYNNEDTNRKITCAAEGSYPAPEFIWKSRGEMEGEAPILISSDTDPNFLINTTGVMSVLMFHNVTYDDQANYICDVKNAAGNNSVEVLVRVKDKYAAVWPFIGIVIEVVVLITIIFLYERHSKKSSSNDDILNVPADEKPLKSDEDGTEIRNRNGNK